MSEQGGIQSTRPQRPANDNPVAWRTHWEALGQPWRTEPEIDKKRQTYLAQRRALVSNIEKGIYPFRDIKLSRADIEWLLATHENGRGPIDWADESQWERRGLDVRGANLCQVNLSYLPLTCLCGSLTWNEWMMATEEQRRMAIVKMNNAIVGNAKLEGATLHGAELKEIALYGTDLRRASLGWATLAGADLGYANLGGADLRVAKLQGIFLFMANLEGANFLEADLREANLHGANLQGADLSAANLEGAKISGVILADKSGISPWLADVQWGSTNLAALDWSQVVTLREEYQAQQKKTPDGNTKDAASQLRGYKTAVRANRQLAVVLQGQGVSEEAARFAYRSQVCKQHILFLTVAPANSRDRNTSLATPNPAKITRLLVSASDSDNAGGFWFRFFGLFDHYSDNTRCSYLLEHGSNI